MLVEAEVLVLPYESRRSGHLLDRLIDELASDRWTEFRAAVAFARRSGNVPDLLDALRRFAEAGNLVSLTFYARKYSERDFASDYGAIEELASALEAGPEASLHLYVQRDITFHPKLYLFANADEALLFVGSSNWSESAWTRNVEGNVALHLDLDDDECRETYDRLIKYFRRYWTG